MKLHDLKPPAGSTKRKRIVGRVIAGKGGKTAGRGTKGQGARDNVKPGFEGGQLPLTQRIPKLKGFKNPFRVAYAVVNLDTLAGLDGTEVNPDTLVAAGLVRKGALVKVLGRGSAPAGLRVTQTRSAIGTKPKHRGTLRALGLRGIGQSNELPDRPEIRGMIARVPHLVSVEEVAG